MMVRPLPTRGFKFQILVENHWSELGRFWAQKHQGNPFRNVKWQRHPYEGVFSLIVFFNRWEIVSGKSVWKSMGTFIARNIFYFEITGFSDHTALTKGDLESFAMCFHVVRMSLEARHFGKKIEVSKIFFFPCWTTYQRPVPRGGSRLYTYP